MQTKSLAYLIGVTISMSSVTTIAADNKNSASKKSSAIPDKREFPLSSKISPCVDFHKYVCENVENSFELRADRRSHDFAFNDSDERLLEIKKKFMKDLPKIKNLDERSQQFRNVYVACMNEKAKAASEKNEVKKMITDMNAITTKEQLVDYQNKNAPNSLGKFISMYSTNNQDDSLKMDVYLDVDFMLLPDHNYYQKKDVVDAYTNLLASFFKIWIQKLKMQTPKLALKTS
jgi:putative endopeptidase